MGGLNGGDYVADILDRLLHSLAQAAPGIAPEAILLTEATLRQEFGGCEGGYIAKKPMLQNAVRLGQRLQAGESIRAAVESSGLSRRHGYRILARPISKR